MLTELWEKQGRPKELVVDGKTFHEFLTFIAKTNKSGGFTPVEFNGSKVILD